MAGNVAQRLLLSAVGGRHIGYKGSLLPIPQPLVTFATKAEHEWVCGLGSRVDRGPPSLVAQSPDLVPCLM